MEDHDYLDEESVRRLMSAFGDVLNNNAGRVTFDEVLAALANTMANVIRGIKCPDCRKDYLRGMKKQMREMFVRMGNDPRVWKEISPTTMQHLH